MPVIDVGKKLIEISRSYDPATNYLCCATPNPTTLAAMQELDAGGGETSDGLRERPEDRKKLNG